MPGTVLRVIPKTRYDFGSQALSTTQTLTVASKLDCSRYREVTLVLRVHSFTVTDTSTISVLVSAEAPTVDDPQFDTITSSTVVASVAVSSSSPAAPILLLAISASIPSGSSVVIQVRCQTSTSVSGPNNAVISADVVLKS